MIREILTVTTGVILLPFYGLLVFAGPVGFILLIIILGLVSND